MGVKAKAGLAGKPKGNEARLGQKFGIVGEELSYTLTPPPTVSGKSSEREEELMGTLQKIYDLVEAEPGLTRELKDKVARLLAKFYHQEEPGFSGDEAYKAIVRDYQMARDIPELSASKPRPRSNRPNSSRKAPVKRETAPVLEPSKSQKAKKPPTLEEILAGRPVRPSDFAASSPRVNSQRQMPRPQSRSMNRNLPAVMPSPTPRMSRSGRPPMMGNMPNRGRMGFGFMGFPMGFGRWGQGFGRPW